MVCEIGENCLSHVARAQSDVLKFLVLFSQQPKTQRSQINTIYVNEKQQILTFERLELKFYQRICMKESTEINLEILKMPNFVYLYQNKEVLVSFHTATCQY